MKNSKSASLVVLLSAVTLTGCAPAGPSALDLATQKVCVKMDNAGFRTDLYYMFSNDNLAFWTQDLDVETAAEFSAMIQPIVDGQSAVALEESTSTFFGKAITASFPALEALQVKCAALGLPVTLPDKFSQYVD